MQRGDNVIFKVLCCAPSNIAVDNLLERLVANKVKVVRLGHPARVHRELQKHSLDAIISGSEERELVSGLCFLTLFKEQSLYV